MSCVHLTNYDYAMHDVPLPPTAQPKSAPVFRSRPLWIGGPHKENDGWTSRADDGHESEEIGAIVDRSFRCHVR